MDQLHDFVVFFKIDLISCYH